MRRSPRRAFALAALLVGSGCVPTRQQTAVASVPTAETEWPVVYTRAMTEAGEMRIPTADRALAEFADRFPGSPEAAEVPYWRALLKLDPANAAATHEALSTLDSYLANTPTGKHRVEALAMKRLGAALEARNAALAAIPPMATVVRPEEKAAQEQEMQRLRDELAKANAELARIRRRLARPRP